jgi:hypothetical protein
LRDPSLKAQDDQKKSKHREVRLPELKAKI